MIVRIFQTSGIDAWQSVADSELTMFDVGSGEIFIVESGGLFEMWIDTTVLAKHTELIGTWTPWNGQDSVVVSEAIPSHGRLGETDRRVSTRMSVSEQRTLNQIALRLGATWSGAGSWRRLLRKIARGEIVCQTP